MNHLLAALLVVSTVTAVDATAQSFQFMRPVTRPRVPLMPLASPAGEAKAGDFDGDGITDLIVVTPGLTRFLRSTAPASPPVLLTTPGTTRPVLGDFDGDGDLDFACVPVRANATSTVTIVQNQQGTLSTILPWGTSPKAGAALGDIDGDGLTDILVAQTDFNAGPFQQVWRGTAGLQFTFDPTAVPAGVPFGWPELLDADGDGDLDVLQFYPSTSWFLLTNVGGSFVDGTGSLPPARVGHDFLARADLDGDGRDDCVATLPNGDIDVFWGGATGLTFTAAVANVPGLLRLWPADFDGDGDSDLLALHPAGLDVFWSVGNRQLSRSAIVTEVANLRGVGDIDADGLADVIFAVAHQDLVRCKFGARFEDAVFAPGTLVPTAPMGWRGTSMPGDVDGDGRTDLVHAGADFVTVDRSIGTGAWQRSTTLVQPIFSNDNCRPMQLADLDADADLDLVIDTNAMLVVDTNNGAGAFSTSMQMLAPKITADGLRIGDVDADGDLDLLRAQDNGVVLMRNLGQGQFAAPSVVVPSASRCYCVELADLDGDGDLDVVTDVLAASGTAHVVLANDGAGNFTNTGFQVNLGTLPLSVRAGDLDGDGDVDLAVDDGSPRVFRSDGSGVFTETTANDLPVTAGRLISNIVVADLDQDGDLDLAAITDTTPSWQLLLNDGSGRFVNAAVTRVQGTAGGTRLYLVAADFDEDGDVELLVGNQMLVNHLRQIRSNRVPRLGSYCDFLLYSGPGFGSALGLLGVGLPPPSVPSLPVPGLHGRLALDPTTLQVIATVQASSIGVSNAFVSVPQEPGLFGLEVWFQAGILPAVGQPGFTNAIHEVVLR